MNLGKFVKRLVGKIEATPVDEEEALLAEQKLFNTTSIVRMRDTQFLRSLKAAKANWKGNGKKEEGL